MVSFILVFLIIGNSEKCSAGFFDYFIESSYSSKFTNISKNNSNQLLINIGHFNEIPIVMSSIDMLKIGLGYKWDNKDCEFFTNFLFLRLRRLYSFILIENKRIDEIGDPIIDIKYSDIQFGFLVLDYYKDAFFDRKINWLGLSADIVYDKLETIFHSQRSYYKRPIISPQLEISPFIGISNIIHSDFFESFDKGLRNNNFGLEAKVNTVAGLLLFRELFIGFNGNCKTFYSKELPLISTTYGAKFSYSHEFEVKYSDGGYSERILNIYANWNYTNFFYSKRSINTQIFNIGVVLY